MKKLLRTIENLKNSEIGGLIESRLDIFEKMGKRSSGELFKELCFCILTANFNAERSIKIQKEIGDGFLTLSEDQLREKLRSLGYRYPNIRAKYIVGAREFKDNLKRIIKSFDNEDELRKWLARSVKGLGYKEASLTHYEKVLIVVDGKVDIIEIGKLFDQYVSGRFKDKRLETFSFNPVTLKFKVAPITNVVRHKYQKELYKVHLKLGKSVSITGDHSVFTFDGKEIYPVEIRKINPGDFLVIPRRLPLVNSTEKELNVVDGFIKRRIFDSVYLKSRRYSSFIRENYGRKTKRKNQYGQHFRGIIPLKVIAGLPKEAYSNDVLKRFGVRISFRRSLNTMKAVIKLDKDFFWVLGLLIAEASIGRNPIEFTLGLEEQKRLLKLSRLLYNVFGTSTKEYKPKYRNVYILKTHNPSFFHLIRDVLGIKGISTTKRVPKLVFSAHFSNIISFLQGHWEGDGWKKSKSYYSISTNSDNLANDLLIVLSMVGVVARFCKKKSKQSKNAGTYTVEFSGIIQPSQLENKEPINRREVIPNVGKLVHNIHKALKIKTKTKGRHTPLYQKVMRWKYVGNPSRENLKKVIGEMERYGSCEELKLLKTIVNSDLSFVGVKKIERISYSNDYVYDIEVSKKGKNFQNFVGGFGGICLHNSHFLRNIGFLNSAIIDFHIINVLVKHGLIEKPRTLTEKRYLRIEDLMKEIAKKADLNLAELDLYLWYISAGKILK